MSLLAYFLLELHLSEVELDTAQTSYSRLTNTIRGYGYESSVEVSARLASELKKRSLIIERDFLKDGLLVNLSSSDKRLVAEGSESAESIEGDHAADNISYSEAFYANQCDSLLFSSLYFSSLKMMGEGKAAGRVFENIMALEEDGSHLQRRAGGSKNGRFVRHPLCTKLALSRDMYLGLLFSLSFEKDKERVSELLTRLVLAAQRDGDYVADGGFFVSLMTPGLKELLRLQAVRHGIPAPGVTFSDRELGLPVSPRGYRLHLHALALLMEIEGLNVLKQEIHKVKYGGAFVEEDIIDYQGVRPGSWLKQQLRLWRAVAPYVLRTPTLAFAPFALLRGVSPEDAVVLILRKRVTALSEILYRKDERNLLFKYVRVKARGQVSTLLASALAAELMSVKNINSDLLGDCTRGSDYLWQRDSSDWRLGPGEVLPVFGEVRPNQPCKKLYSGIDFLFLGSLLSRDMPQAPVYD